MVWFEFLTSRISVVVPLGKDCRTFWRGLSVHPIKKKTVRLQTVGHAFCTGTGWFACAVDEVATFARQTVAERRPEPHIIRCVQGRPCLCIWHCLPFWFCHIKTSQLYDAAFVVRDLPQTPMIENATARGRRCCSILSPFSSIQ